MEKDYNDLDIAYLEKAIELSGWSASKEGSLAGGPFGAIIVDKEGNIIGQAINNVLATNDPTSHAEVMAIRMACNNIKSFDLKEATLYTSCEPCPMCLSAIYWARLDRLVYAATRQDAAGAGFDDEFIYKEIPLANSQRSLECNHFSLEEGCDPFEIWNSKSDKTEY